MAWNELIRRNDALEIVRRTNGDYAAAFSAINRLETMPSVSAIPAKWICKYDEASKKTEVICSRCCKSRWMNGCFVSKDGSSLYNADKYCPQCGAAIGIDVPEPLLQTADKDGNRLTSENGEHKYSIEAALCRKTENGSYNGAAIDKLAAYENTGLSPEDVERLVKEDFVRGYMPQLLNKVSARRFAEYLTEKGWIRFPVTRNAIDLYQFAKDGMLFQIRIPVDIFVANYETVMLHAICTVAGVEGIPAEKLMARLIKDSNVTTIRSRGKEAKGKRSR